MAYTAAMDETTPAGTDAAATADDQLRALKRDIKERLHSFFVDWNTDPLVAKDGAIITSLYMTKNAGGTAAVFSNNFSGGVNILYICADGSADGHYPKLPTRTALAAGDFLHNGLFYIDQATLNLVYHQGAVRYKVNLTAF